MTGPAAESPIIDRFEAALFLITSALYQASRLGVNLVAAAMLSPTVFGLWNIVVVLQTYTTHGNLGVLSGANRRVPILLGSGAAPSARDVERTAYGGSLLAGAVLAVAASVVGLALGGVWQVAGVLLGLGVWAQQVYLWGQVVLRGNLQFHRASVQQMILAVVFPVIAVPGLTLGGIHGLILAQSLTYAAGCLLVLRWRAELRPTIERETLVSLIREGAPIMLAGLAFAAMTSIDRWVLVATGTAEELGHYALASTISASLLFVNVVLAQQMYPRMAHAYGAGGSVAAVRAVAHRQSILAGGFVLALAVALIVAAPLIVPLVLPAYVASIGTIQILSVAYAVLAVCSGYANLLVTVGRAWSLLAIQVGTAVLTAGLAAVAIQAGLGPLGVAVAVLVSFGALAISSAYLALRLRPVRPGAR